MKYAVGIDVGGTNTRVALINEEYKILERIKFSTDSKIQKLHCKRSERSSKDLQKRSKELGFHAQDH